MIHLDNVSVIAAQNQLLKNITLTIKEHRVGIVGANGSGKSTLVKLIKGLTKPSSGKIAIKQKKIGYIFQDPEHQIIFPLVEDDLAFGLKNLGFKPEYIRHKVDEVITAYGLEKLRGQVTYHLSGGQKQLLAIAGVLAMEPELVIFDEPTTLLDLKNKNRVLQLMQQLPQPLLLVTHDLDLLQKFERVIVLDGGEIVFDDIPQRALKFYVDSMQ